MTSSGTAGFLPYGHDSGTNITPTGGAARRGAGAINGEIRVTVNGQLHAVSCAGRGRSGHRWAPDRVIHTPEAGGWTARTASCRGPGDRPSRAPERTASNGGRCMTEAEEARLSVLVEARNHVRG